MRKAHEEEIHKLNQKLEFIEKSRENDLRIADQAQQKADIAANTRLQELEKVIVELEHKVEDAEKSKSLLKGLAADTLRSFRQVQHTQLSLKCILRASNKQFGER